MKAKSYDEAITAYSRSLELDPDQPFTYSNRAMTYLKQKQFQLALDDAEKALEMDPKYLKAFHRRAKAHAGLGNYEKAIDDFQMLLEKEPENKELNKELKDCRFLLKKQIEKNEKTSKESEPKIEELDDKENVKP